MTGERAPAGQSGFSLLALLLLLAGLGVGMAALGTVWHTAAQREKEAELLFIGSQYRQAIESFWNLSPAADKRLPKKLDELLADPRFPNTMRHLRRAYRDPMTHEGEWGLVKEPGGGISGVYSLSEGRPFKSAGFSTGQAQFQEAKSYRDWVFRFDYAKALKDAQAKEAPAANPATPAGAPNPAAGGKPAP